MSNLQLSKVFGKTNYCHEHGRHIPCEKCNDVLVDIGIQADKDRIAWLESENEALREDAARFRKLETMYHGAHFDYDESQKCVIVFAIPDGARISANLKATIDGLKT